MFPFNTHQIYQHSGIIIVTIIIQGGVSKTNISIISYTNRKKICFGRRYHVFREQIKGYFSNHIRLREN